ncbi:Retinoblastoma-like protein 1, variant 2 [Chamberlinius hualienensis]
MKNWADMASLPYEFREKVDRLERNFAVSTVIFKKFEPIFMDIFVAPTNETPKPRIRKQKRPCTSSDVFAFCWTLFVQVKGSFPAISDDLVNSYHLLLSCMDLIYANLLMSDRRDLLNKNFSGLPENFDEEDYCSPTEPPCIVDVLCTKHDGLAVEAKTIKEHYCKPHIKKMFETKVLKGKIDTLSGLLDQVNFENNSKAVNTAYEMFVLNVGDFDERIFLKNGGASEIGTAARCNLTSNSNSLMECMQNARNLERVNPLAPQTPLTGRRYLTGRERGNVTPVSTATQSVSRLQALLCGRKTGPSDALLEIFKNCNKDPTENITNLVKSLGETFCTFYGQPTDDHPRSHIDFAKTRLQLGECLYYKALESMLAAEKKRLNSKADFSTILDCDQFHRSLFACCLEIVIFSYNSQRVFPWILEVLNIESYHFYKVIEIFIRAEDSLSRDVVKHLNHIEEQILESLAWKSDSPLWDAIKEAGSVPSCEDVCLPTSDDLVHVGGSQPLQATSPVPHPALRRLALDKTIVKSPQSPLSVSDRYQSTGSPGQVSTAKRRLFSTNPIPVAISRPTTSTSSQNSSTQTQIGETMLLTATTTVGSTVPVLASQKTVTIVQAQNDGGFIAYAPAQFVAIPLTAGTSIAGVSVGASASSDSSPNSKPKKGGSLGLFFRKFYQMTSVRLQELCDRLEIKDEDLRKKIWTCFEHSIVNSTDLMLDRYVDQLIMCAVYVMSKVTNANTKFMEIIKCYRMQPQALSHIYRSVLLTSKKRHSSTGSSSSSGEGSKQGGASESNSPVPMEKDDEKEKDDKRNLRLAIRSSSTLPVDHHSSSQPPTPTKLAGSSNTFGFEDRGDLITFYNKVYIARMQQFVLKFSTERSNNTDASPPLSPLPLPKNYNMSPRRKISSNHSVFISPLKCSPSPSKPLSYSFSKSPAKDLRAINNMVRSGGEHKIGKRILQDDGDSDNPVAKRSCLDSTFRKIQSVITERQSTTTSAN